MSLLINLNAQINGSEEVFDDFPKSKVDENQHDDLKIEDGDFEEHDFHTIF